MPFSRSTSRRLSGRLVPWLVVAAALSSNFLHAQPSASDQARAEVLFRAGRELMADKKYGEACPKFAESQRLDPGPGTLVNLARCHQLEGRLATAWAEYNEFLALPRGESKKWADWERSARDGVGEITPNLSKIVIEVPPEVAQLKGLRVQRDESVVSAAEWGVAVPVDPGPHTITVTADGKRPWTQLVTLGAQADRKTVKVSPLEATPSAPAVSSAPPAASAPPVTSAPPPAASTPAPAAPMPVVEPSDRRTLGLILGGVGIVGIGVGGFFGARASSRWDEAKAACPERACPDPKAVDRRNEAVTAANIANVGFGVGLAGLGVGAYLLLSRAVTPPPASPTTATRVVPTVQPGAAGVSVSGAF